MIVVLMLVVFTACSTTKDIIKETTYIHTEISSGHLQENLKSVSLSSAEIITINHAINEVNKFRTTYIEFLKQPKNIFVFKPEDLARDYNNLKQRFFEVETIVENNFDKYSEATQKELIKYRDYSYSLDKKIQKYNKEQKFISAMLNSINYTFALVKMIVALK